MINLKSIILGIVIVIIVFLIFYLQSLKPERVSPKESNIVVEKLDIMTSKSSINKEEKSKKYLTAYEITTPDGFINTDKISISEFIGKKIILVDFWTYSCINCQRTTPYLNAWHEKYSANGLVIIGIHTPEFEFEKKYENVLAAVKKFKIKYPVVLDNDYSTWTAYRNRYWPRKYLIDIDGYIIYDHIGEGAYEETEKKIQEALEERKVVLGMKEEISKDISIPSDVIKVDALKQKSLEIYFGASRNEYLSNGEINTVGVQNFSKPSDIKTNNLYLEGEWNIQNEFAENKNANAKIIFRYQARNVYLVAGAEKDTKIKIFQDGKFVKELIVNEHNLYDIIKDADYGEHTLEIIVGNPNLRAFTFTFG